MQRFPRLLFVLFVVAVVVVAVVDGGTPPPAATAGSVDDVGQREARPHTGSPVALVAASADRHAEQHEMPAPDTLASDLQLVLSHHATLATRLTRATLTGAPGFTDAAENAVVRNIDDLRTALEPVIGGDAARQISGQWERQTRSVFMYATAVRDDEADGRRRARQQLDRVIDDQASTLARLADGRVDAGEAAEMLRTFFDHEIAQVEHYAAGDYDRAYELQRLAFAEAFPLGRMMAATALPVPKSSPTDELHTALSMLLGEHVELAIDAMRAGAVAADDFGAAAAALDANTADVTMAMDTLFGAKQAQVFNDVWADHIDLFVDYTVAVVEDDTAARQAVRNEFDRVLRRFGTVLEGMSGGRLESEDVTAAMGEHEQQLIDQIEHYVDDDFGTAYETSYTAYQHIRHMADVLAGPFAEAVAEDMPRGGAQTGGGGTVAARTAAPARVAEEVRRHRSVRSHMATARPVAVRLPAIGVSSDLQRLGRGSDGAIEVPGDWQQAGWYREGPKPGQAGPAVILGHVDSRSGPGVFHRLHDLRVGDEILVDRADGTTVVFVVESSERHAKTRFPTQDVYMPTLRPTVRLVTCGGPFDVSSGHYRDNVVVFGTLVE